MVSGSVSFTIATWNVNSVRLRIDLVLRLLRERQPDVLCLQETKCPMGQFPGSALGALGYGHIAESGQPGYHGVAIVSRRPFLSTATRFFCDKGDCRHVSVVFGGPEPLILHNLYVPAGGDVPDPEVNGKFAHKLQFIDELAHWFAASAVPARHRAICVGDLNVAPLENDVWSHRQMLGVVSHTPREVEGFERMRQAGRWVDVVRVHVPQSERLYTWWSYRARDWALSDRGRRLDHIWASPDLAPACRGIEIIKAARGWPQPSDHVPVLARFGLSA